MAELFDRHRPTLDVAVSALRTPEFWSPFPEVPSGKICGETARENGTAAFEALNGKPVALPGHPEMGRLGDEISPFDNHRLPPAGTRRRARGGRPVLRLAQTVRDRPGTDGVAIVPAAGRALDGSHADHRAQIFDVVKSLRALGVTVLLVEQNAFGALKIADRGYVIKTGQITMQGPAEELIADPRIREAYLGI